MGAEQVLARQVRHPPSALRPLFSFSQGVAADTLLLGPTRDRGAASLLLVREGGRAIRARGAPPCRRHFRHASPTTPTRPSFPQADAGDAPGGSALASTYVKERVEDVEAEGDAEMCAPEGLGSGARGKAGSALHAQRPQPLPTTS